MKNDNSTKQSNATKSMLANRLLKFRAWVKEQNRMIKVFGFNEHLIFEQTWDSPSIKENIFEIEDCHIMQFTGLKDKNGKEIYEGDIIVEENSKRYVVKWEEDTSCSSNSSSCGFCWSKEDATYTEVIGNIYENPELTQTTS